MTTTSLHLKALLGLERLQRAESPPIGLEWVGSVGWVWLNSKIGRGGNLAHRLMKDLRR